MVVAAAADHRDRSRARHQGGLLLALHRYHLGRCAPRCFDGHGLRRRDDLGRKRRSYRQHRRQLQRRYPCFPRSSRRDSRAHEPRGRQPCLRRMGCKAHSHTRRREHRNLPARRSDFCRRLFQLSDSRLGNAPCHRQAQDLAFKARLYHRRDRSSRMHHSSDLLMGGGCQRHS